MKNMHFSPSECHTALISKTVQTLAYPGKAGIEKWRVELRAKLKDLTGLSIMPSKKAPLNTRSIWKRSTEHGTIEKIVFTSEPFAEVPAYVCVPHEVAKKGLWMICLQGHSTGMHNSIAVSRNDDTVPAEIEGDRDFAIGCMKRGIAALCIEQRAFGERSEQKQKEICSHNTCHDAAMHAIMLGRTLIGERVYDVDRGIDYLLSRKDVSPRCIGIMGNSGGGTISLFAGAMLDRISFMMPSCYFCTFKDSIMSIYHCGCNYVPGLLNCAEMSDVLGLFAPKPLLVVAGSEDPIFPIEAVKKSFARLKKIYKDSGAAENCRLHIGDGGHRFYADGAWPIFLSLIE